MLVRLLELIKIFMILYNGIHIIRFISYESYDMTEFKPYKARH